MPLWKTSFLCTNCTAPRSSTFKNTDALSHTHAHTAKQPQMHQWASTRTPTHTHPHTNTYSRTHTDTHTHKHTVQAGEKSEEMLMPTNTLRRRCVALMWSLSHTKANRRSLAGPIKLFSECCGAEMARLVNPVCSWQKCSSITQVCVVALLWSHLEGGHSLCVRWRGLVICREGLVMLCLLASVHQLSWLLHFRDFCFRGVFFFFFSSEHWHC